ncbi:HD-GYP domain-containing protein [Colwellia sp. 1_MG-2023]|uniref:HD-GYP domain-containing protein n=1 Tax=Colwellia sp. 1_MG-2023 TaxID=3062649 RepID=UPI0026E230E8|nr:HD-GYP domain-containing protein [Colwellia sp. 1_MG-2023]MDO6446302.1 HD-GYP domain-containing protein [Colwellia sp. 1_MG-2023]
MLKDLTIDELKVGMFVKDIFLKDSDHKVKNQGVVNSARTIELLKKQGVVRVVIDCEQSNFSDDEPDIEDNESDTENDVEETSLTDEFARSCDIYQQSAENVKALMLNASSAKPLSMEAMTVLAGEITNSITRNEHAMTILTRIRQKSNYQWEHAINCAVLICGFSLYLGFKKNTVQELTLGALIHDIGSAKVSRAILEKQDKLTKNEMSVVQKHVLWGMELSKREGFSSPILSDMLVNHHERLDGSGYPRGIAGDKISKLSRITAIVDVYDAMTADKPYKKAMLPQAVFRHLLNEKKKFDADIVQQFIKYLGIHPVGSLVELSNEKIAIVIEGNRTDPLKPKIKVIYSLKLNSYTKPVDFDLTQEEFVIINSIKASDYQINLNKTIRDIVT